MLTETIRLGYRLSFLSAFHLGTGRRSGAIHRAVIRDASGYLFVPGSTIKGVLRDRCTQIANLFNPTRDNPHADGLDAVKQRSQLVDSIFGSLLHTGSLYFDDAALSTADRTLFTPPDRDAEAKLLHQAEFQSWQTEKRTQVSIWRPTGTAQSKRLYNSEYGISGLAFDGRIAGALRSFATLSEPPLSYSLILLVAGLLSLDRIGGAKSTGAGQVKTEITELLVGGKAVDPAEVISALAQFDLYQLVEDEGA